MRLLNLYLFRTLFFSTMSLSIGLTFVVWLTQSLKLLELIIDGGAPVSMFGTMLVLILPRFLEVVTPIAAAISCLFIYNKLTMDSEIVVMRAVGMSNRALAAPAIWLAMILAVAVFVLSGWITPLTKASLDKQKQTLRSELTGIVIKPGIFNDLGSGITIYINKRNSPFDFEGVFIYNASDATQKPAVITAKRGRLDLRGTDPKVIVEEGIQQSTDPKTGYLNLLRFDKYTVSLNVFNKKSVVLPPDADARTINNLLSEIGSDKIKPQLKREYWGEIHRRICRPLYTIGFSLAALACLLFGPFDRRGQGKRISFSIFLLIMLQGLVLGLDNAAGKSNIGVIGLYFISVFPGYVSYKILGMQSRKWDIQAIIKQVFSPERLL